MSATVNFDYDHVFNLASQLSPEERTRLLRELPRGKTPKSEIKYESEFESFLPAPDAPLLSREEFLEVLRNGPVIPEEQIELMLAAREEVNKCQPISW
jgi:hypothetical protein